MSSIEAMAMGLCCATELNKKYENFIPDHPFININGNNIYEQLSKVVSNTHLLGQMKHKSREWVELTHDINKVGEILYSYYEQL